MFSSAIFPLKVLKLSNRGSLSISKPFGILLKGFFVLNYFPEKEGYLKPISYIINMCEISH